MTFLSNKKELAVVLVIAWFVFSVLNLLLNGYWWGWEILGMIPTFVWLGVSLIVLGISVYSHRLAAMLLALVAFVLFMPFTDLSVFSKGKVSTPESTSVKLFNFNTELWYEGEPEDFIAFLKAQDADIYQLQEAFDTELNLVDAEAYLAPYFPEYRIKQAGDVVTMSRLPVIGYQQSNTYQLWQGFLRTDIEVGDSLYSFYNVHLPVPIRPDRIEGPIQFINQTQDLLAARNAHSKLLHSDIAQQKAQGYKVVLTGDFNSTSFHQHMHPLVSDFQLQDAHASSYFGYPITFEFKGLRLWRLDWGLVDPEIRIDGYLEQTLPEMSDHDAFTLELSI